MPHKKDTTSPRKTSSSKVRSSTRKLAQPTYRRFRLQKRIKHPAGPLPTAWQLFKDSVQHVWQHKKLFGGIALIYLALTLVLVRGYIVTNDLGTAKQAIEELVTGVSGQLASSLALLGILLGSSATQGAAAAVYQAVIAIIVSLAVIWALRQTHAKKHITVKESYYKSSYPLVPFILVLIVIGLQLLPFMVGNFLYSAATRAGLTATVFENAVWLAFTFILVVWTFYMITASLFALYIVTLPNMEPLQSLRSAKQLVKHRRWTVMRKLMFLPFALLVFSLIIMVPVIMFLTPIAEVVFLLMTATLLPLSHSYVYTLYKELL